ncbi:MAG: T9SS type A sorting domain-containing protein [Bacteroidaceae bacterium]|nr:T9SS type A sorting domain-containing protein [Bacteroidaceae bacterium]
MIKKIYSLLGLLLATTGIQAQTILYEDFETEATEYCSEPVATDPGWTVINGSADGLQYNWHNYYAEKGHNTGSKHVACVDAKTYEAAGVGLGPREEILLSPEIDLNDTYQLSFDWSAGPMAWMDKSRYDLQVRVVTDGDVNNAETIFSIQNNQILKLSGVDPSSIGTWDAHKSKVGLEEWKGQKVKLAFVYKMMNVTGNQVCLDNVMVKKYSPETGPRATVSLTNYVFPSMYIGEKYYSEVIKLTNAGLDGLKITSVDCPSGLALNIDPATVNLASKEYVNFQLSYTASLFSPASGAVVLHTTGGDVSIKFTATKEALEDGYVIENFENHFAPAGWKNKGWSRATTAIEGDYSASANGGYSDAILVSPRLNVKEGDKLSFTYYNDFTNGDGSEYQYNDFSVEVSYDGGATWQTMWIFNYEDGTKLETLTLNFTQTSDDTYVRWKNTAVSITDEGAEPYSNVILDRIVLPEYYGAAQAPAAAEYVAPADATEDVYPRNIKLEWKPVLFANGYRVYVYKNDGSKGDDYLINGVDVDDALSYNITRADYETTYSWKVVPYNTNGSAEEVPVWSFTTQKDATTSVFPYMEDFSKCGTGIPAGWTSSSTSPYGASRNWSTNTSKYWGSEPGSLYSMWLGTGEISSVTTQEFKLPASGNYQISFVWGNNHPASLKIDESDLHRNSTPAGGNNGFAEIVFEVIADGVAHQVGYISEPKIDDDYNFWTPESFNLSEFAGQTVQFRWTHRALSGRDNGAGLDNILIEEIAGKKAAFNQDEWNAGKVNYNKSTATSTVFTLLNKGVESLTVESATFNTENFSTSLKAGDVIAVDGGIEFTMQFDALTSASNIDDELTVTFEGGYSVKLPVHGKALAEDVLYYAFEKNELDYNWNDDFTLIDVDRQATLNLSSYWIQYDLKGAPFAFAQGYDSEMYHIMKPTSGDGALIAATPASDVSESEDWIVSKALSVNSNSTFNFMARNYESLESVLPNPRHRIEVLVSTTSAKDRKSFETVMKGQEIPFLTSGAWQSYSVDLSKYAGQTIYVALKHYTVGGGLLAFFDDFTFNHVSEGATRINAVSADDLDNATIYTVDGKMVGKGNIINSLGRGMYIIKTTKGQKKIAVK